VYFPSAAPSGAEVSGTVPIDGATPRRSGWNVLIVDDDPAVRRVAAAALSSEGYRVEQADCAPAALARLEDPQGGVDLVLLDLTMPDMDGAEVLATLARRGAAVPVIVMSGFQADVLPERTGYAHLRGFVAKPFRVAELREAVRRGIAAEAP
ncbi:MAG: response regulator, partial [Myxococcales bacterium]|nr:response regulator [Myxococcales bacterium]